MVRRNDAAKKPIFQRVISIIGRAQVKNRQTSAFLSVRLFFSGSAAFAGSFAAISGNWRDEAPILAVNRGMAGL